MSELGRGIARTADREGGIMSVQPHIPAQIVEHRGTMTHAGGSVHDKPVPAIGQFPDRLRGLKVEIQVMCPELLQHVIARITADVKTLNQAISLICLTVDGIG